MAAQHRPGRPPPNHPARPSRRRFLKRALLGAVGLFAGGGVWTAWREPGWLTVYRRRVPLPGLPPALDGFTIGQLSDLHFGRIITPEHVRRAVDMLMELRPDLIALTGDYVWGGARAGHVATDALAPLQAEHGVYAVLGNHDYWSKDAPGISQVLTDLGFVVLTNQSARVQTRGTDWWMCGVDDMWAGEPNLDAALRGVPAEAFHVLLSHAPDFADRAAAQGVPLQLSGHSHGGQVRLPLLGAPVLPLYGRKYPMGLQPVAGTSALVYTNVGVGCISPPVRLNCRPEVTLLTLTQAS